MPGRLACLALLVICGLAPAQTPVFRSTTNLQSIAVQVVDRRGNFVPGLTANDFTLLEDGRPQRVAFFATQHQPVSLAILLDSSHSMDSVNKFDRARKLIAPLIAGQHPDDEVSLVLFTDKIYAIEQLTPDRRKHPELITLRRGGVERGTALYDAVASALCRMRTAENLRQAIVVLTDGADQHSRLNLEQLVELAQMSTPQIFMIGFFDRIESRIFQQSQKTVQLLGEREIDNPLFVFDRLGKESGAEAFFPTSDKDLKAAVDRISKMLQAEYTLAYYPESTDHFRRIEVQVRRKGVKVITRRGVGASSAAGPVVFKVSTCEISAQDHPYPWELKSTLTSAGALLYHDDFSDPKSGWPNRNEQLPAGIDPSMSRRLVGRNYRPGLRYVSGSYEISRHVPANLVTTGPIQDGVIATYGPHWRNFRASVSVQTDWTRTLHPKPTNDDLLVNFEIAPGLVFHMNEEGYYAVVLAGGLVTNAVGERQRTTQFKLVRRLFADSGPGEHHALIPWTPVHLPTARGTHKLAAEYRDGEITVFVDDVQVGAIRNDRFPSGSAGLALFGNGDAIYDDLRIQSLPR